MSDELRLAREFPATARNRALGVREPLDMCGPRIVTDLMLLADPSVIFLVATKALGRVELRLAIPAAIIYHVMLVSHAEAGAGAEAGVEAGAGAGEADGGVGGVVEDGITVGFVCVGDVGRAFIVDVLKGSSCAA